ncbi:MAG: hypothetical protein U0Z53_27420 [Blastocatellia bacterium]
MFGRKMTMMVASLALLFSMAVPSLAGGEFHRRAELQKTESELEREHHGLVEIDRKGEKDRFRVSVETRAPEGTTYAIYADDRLAGIITIDAFGHGEFERRGDDGKPMPAVLSNVTAIAGVKVKNEDGMVVLKVDF